MLLRELDISQVPIQKSRKTSADKFDELIKLPKSKKKYHRSIYDLESNKDVERLGSGAYAHAYASTKEPGTAIKVAKPQKDLKHDGYFQYIEMLSKHKEGSDNRYFPKIYDVQIFQTKEGNYTYSADMERLLPLSTLSNEELETIGNHIFNNFGQMVSSSHDARKRLQIDKQNRKVYGNEPWMEKTPPREHGKDKALKGSDNYTYAINSALFTGISNAMTSDSPATYIKDPEFKRAMMIVRSLVQKTKNNPDGMTRRGPDIHGGNIMVRRGPYMPQLVLTDPFV
jgi:hypothetical protein